jgi:uncharacterized protein
MTAFTTLYEESRDPANRDFYAPCFELRIDGTPPPKSVVRDVMEVVYHDDITSIDGFEITVNNWDDSAFRCKYIGSETAAQLGQGSNLFTLFNPGQTQVELALGYVGNLQTMVHATFQSLDPTFPDSGPPLLSVRGLNILQQFRKKKYSNAWTNLTPSNIALAFNSLRDKGTPRIPSPWQVAVNPQNEVPIDFVAQKDQYDVDFLLQLANGQGYVLEVHDDTKQLYFGPSTQTQPTNYQLEWGKGLISFKPSLSCANQWQSVTVKGWDRQAQKPISVTVDLNDPQVKKINPNLHGLIQDRQQQTVDLPVFTTAEAQQMARAMLLDRTKMMVTAKAKTIGLPSLRAGTRVNIQGIGARLSGTYFVTKTTHTLGENGYTTEFDCRREDPSTTGGGP